MGDVKRVYLQNFIKVRARKRMLAVRIKNAAYKPAFIVIHEDTRI